LAQDAAFPNRQMRIIVPLAPGGSNDTLGRMMADRLRDRFGQLVFAENRPGSASNIGFELVATAAPDGYTLLLAPDSLTVNPALFQNLRYNPQTSFAAVIQLARARPDTLNIASPGNASAGQLTGVLLAMRANTRWTHVPYRGGGPAVTDRLAGTVDALWVTPAPALPHMRSGALRPLAVNSQTRATGLADVPTVAEQGFAGFEVINWQGIPASAGTPPAIIQRLNAALNAVLEEPPVKARLADPGLPDCRRPARGAGPHHRRQPAALAGSDPRRRHHGRLMDLRIKGDQALVVGASDGIGLATAAVLAAEGAAVTIVSRDAAALVAAAAGIGTAHIAADATDAASVAALVAAWGARPLDILVVAVGGSQRSPFEALTDEDWRRNWEFNILATVGLVRGLLPARRLAPGARVVLFGGAHAPCRADRQQCPQGGAPGADQDPFAGTSGRWHPGQRRAAWAHHYPAVAHPRGQTGGRGGDFVGGGAGTFHPRHPAGPVRHGRGDRRCRGVPGLAAQRLCGRAVGGGGWGDRAGVAVEARALAKDPTPPPPPYRAVSSICRRSASFSSTSSVAF